MWSAKLRTQNSNGLGRFSGRAAALAGLLSLSLSPWLPALCDPFQVEGASESEILSHIDLHNKPDKSTHVFLSWIDHNGKKVRDLNYEAVDVLQGGVTAAVQGDDYNSVLIDTTGAKLGKEEFASLGHYSEGLVPAETGMNWGFIDRSGEYVINPQFVMVEEFSEGLAPACKDKLFGYIDRLGNFAIPPTFDSALSFHENLAAAQFKGKWGYINKDGSFVIPPKYEGAGKFSDERALVKLGGKWGVIDTTGKVIVEPKFEDAVFYREGVCPVKDGAQWGFIDREGAVTIPPKLDRAFSFHEGNSAVRVGTKFGYIDHQGNFEIPAKFDLALPFAEGVAVVGEINWNHPSARMFLLSRHLGKIDWPKDDSANALTGYSIPANEADAVKELLKVLPKQSIEDIKLIGLDEMQAYQYSLGMELRNNWGLWKGSRLGKYYGKKGVKGPEEMTANIFTALWKNVHKAG